MSRWIHALLSKYVFKNPGRSGSTPTQATPAPRLTARPKSHFRARSPDDGPSTIGVLAIRQRPLIGRILQSILKRGNVWRLNSNEKMQGSVSGAR